MSRLGNLCQVRNGSKVVMLQTPKAESYVPDGSLRPLRCWI